MRVLLTGLLFSFPATAVIVPPIANWAAAERRAEFEAPIASFCDAVEDGSSRSELDRLASDHGLDLVPVDASNVMQEMGIIDYTYLRVARHYLVDERDDVIISCLVRLDGGGRVTERHMERTGVSPTQSRPGQSERGPGGGGPRAPQ